MPIDLSPFSEALLREQPHPHLYLSVCAPIERSRRAVGASDVRTASLGGRIRMAVWFYFLDKFVIRIIYAETGERRQGVVESWHPKTVSKIIRVVGL